MRSSTPPKSRNDDAAPVLIKVRRQKVEAVPYYESEIDRLNAAIDQLRGQILQQQSKQTAAAAAKEEDEPSETEALVDAHDRDHNAAESPTSANNDSLEVDAPETLLLKNTTSSSSGGDHKNDNGIPTANASSNKSHKNKSNKSFIKTNSKNKNNSRTTSTAFVTFRTLKAKQTAVQCEIAGDPDRIYLSTASDAASVIWENVAVPVSRQNRAQFLCGLGWCVGILFWAIPMSFVTSIANLNGILEACGIAAR